MLRRRIVVYCDNCVPLSWLISQLVSGVGIAAPAGCCWEWAELTAGYSHSLSCLQPTSHESKFKISQNNPVLSDSQAPMSEGGSRQVSGSAALELWCRLELSSYPGLIITNMSSDWRTGVAFCALVNRFRPDLLDMSAVSRAEDAEQWRRWDEQLSLWELYSQSTQLLRNRFDHFPEGIVSWHSEWRSNIWEYQPCWSPGMWSASITRTSCPYWPTRRSSITSLLRSVRAGQARDVMENLSEWSDGQEGEVGQQETGSCPQSDGGQESEVSLQPPPPEAGVSTHRAGQPFQQSRSQQLRLWGGDHQAQTIRAKAETSKGVEGPKSVPGVQSGW